MALYYFIPVFVVIFLGTITASFLTIYVGGNPVASVPRAFVFTLVKLFLLYFFGMFLPNSVFFFLLMLLCYYFLFLKLYNASYLRGLRFLFLMSVFTMTYRLVLIGPLTKSAVSIIF